MSDLELFYAVPSRGMVAHWMLEEIGVPYKRTVLSLEAEEHKTPGYLKINPMGRVPALVHDGVVVTETAAIVTYLADAFPEAGLAIPAESPLRGEYLRWIFFAVASAEPAILWASLGEVKTERDYLPYSDVDTVAQTIAGAVRGKTWVVGDRFTAADVMLGTTVMWGLNLMPVLPRLAGHLLG